MSVRALVCVSARALVCDSACLATVCVRACADVCNSMCLCERFSALERDTNTNPFISGKNPYTIGTYISISK